MTKTKELTKAKDTGPITKGYGIFHLIPTQGYGVLNFQSDPVDLTNFLREVKFTKYLTISSAIKKEFKDEIIMSSQVLIQAVSDINILSPVMKSEESECNIFSRIDNSRLIAILQVL